MAVQVLKTLISATFLLALALPQPVRAIEIFGMRFFEPQDADTIELIDPLPYTADLQSAGGLQDEISAASALITNANRPAAGSSGLLATARNDYARIVDALYAAGHYGGEVSITINGAEAAGLPLDVEIDAPVTIIVSVDPGPLYRFAIAGIENRHPGTDITETGFARGAAARSTSIRDAGITAVEAWQMAGHPKARVAGATVVADHANRRLEATLTIDAGPRLAYGPITVTGTERVDEDFVRYIADLPAGQIYDPARIARGRALLLDLDTFRSVDIREGAGQPDGTMPIEIALADRLPRRFGVGASVSSTDGLGVEGFWLHRNLFGRAERLRFDGSIQGFGRSSDPNDYDYEAIGTFIKPGVFAPDTDFHLTFGASFENQPNYSALALDAETGLSTVLYEFLTGHANLVWERSRVDDDLGRRRFNVLGIEVGLTYDDRDVPLDATRGTYADLSLFPFHEMGYGEIAGRTTLEVRNYQSFGEEDRFTLAGRAKIGSVVGIPSTAAPPQTLFFSGGGGSVRGYDYLSNGVTLPNGDVVGGLSVIELSGEVRTRLNESFGAVAFIDAGLVGAEEVPDLSDPWEVGIGAGLRWQTGLGPLRIDIARGLDLSAGDPNFALYIGLGQAF